MASKKKPSSCLGIFFKGFVLTFLILSVLFTAGIMIGIKFLGADPALWLDYSHWNSHFLMGFYAIAAFSFFIGSAVALFIAGASKFLDSGKPRTGGPAKKFRPQSNRKTTL